MIFESMRVELIAIVSVRILIEFIEVSKIHSTWLTLEKSVGAVTTRPSNGTIITLIHLGVTPRSIVTVATMLARLL